MTICVCVTVCMIARMPGFTANCTFPIPYASFGSWRLFQMDVGAVDSPAKEEHGAATPSDSFDALMEACAMEGLVSLQKSGSHRKSHAAPESRSTARSTLFPDRPQSPSGTVNSSRPVTKSLLTAETLTRARSHAQLGVASAASMVKSVLLLDMCECGVCECVCV